ncbi:MAG: hypothetical protein QLV_11 [Qinghai Lake virophage]|uniref:Uncharacterized protein n=1 Tax=Qinghai Lake virophage TaxID=1516115 RepID=A0A0R5K4Q4_9VIRU|nr:MAG: hypothetical protein QLV_11 [Qinghai Lake virophage]
MKQNRITQERNKIANCYCKMIKNREKGDVVWTWNKTHMAFSVYKEEQFRPQMAELRRLAKEGEIVIKKYNSNSATTFDGNEWHFLVVQRVDKTYDTFDPAGLFLLGIGVEGDIYAFKRRTNRNRVQKYIMNGLDNGMCVLCNNDYGEWGNNPAPLKEYGKCCNECNVKKFYQQE